MPCVIRRGHKKKLNKRIKYPKRMFDPNESSDQSALSDNRLSSDFADKSLRPSRKTKSCAVANISNDTSEMQNAEKHKKFLSNRKSIYQRLEETPKTKVYVTSDDDDESTKISKPVNEKELKMSVDDEEDEISINRKVEKSQVSMNENRNYSSDFDVVTELKDTVQDLENEIRERDCTIAQLNAIITKQNERLNKIYSLAASSSDDMSKEVPNKPRIVDIRTIRTPLQELLGNKPKKKSNELHSENEVYAGKEKENEYRGDCNVEEENETSHGEAVSSNHSAGLERYTIRDGKVWLGDNVEVDEAVWDHSKRKDIHLFLRDVVRLFWSDHELSNRCIDLSKTSRENINRSPRKIVTPRKLHRVKEIYKDELVRRKKKNIVEELATFNRNVGNAIRDCRKRTQ